MTPRWLEVSGERTLRTTTSTPRLPWVSPRQRPTDQYRSLRKGGFPWCFQTEVTHSPSGARFQAQPSPRDPGVSWDRTFAGVHQYVPITYRDERGTAARVNIEPPTAGLHQPAK